MSDGGLIVLWFSLSLVGAALVIWTSIRVAKHKLPRWDSSLSTWFIVSIGGFGQRQIDNWKRWAAFDEGQAKIIVKFQVTCWVAMILWSIVSMAIVMGCKAFTYENGQTTRVGSQAQSNRTIKITATGPSLPIIDVRLDGEFRRHICCLLSLLPSLAQDARILDHFMWKKNSVSGSELAGSQSKSSFNFFDVGDLSSNSLQLVEQDIDRISSAAGLTVDRSSGTSPTLAIVHDSTAFSRLRNDKAAFRSLGLPGSLLTKLESQISETSTCATLTLIDDKGDIRVTIVLLSEKFNVCLLDGLLNSFGIVPIDPAATDIGARSLTDACILYEGRRLSLRDRQSLTNNMSKLQSICLAKTGASK